MKAGLDDMKNEQEKLAFVNKEDLEGAAITTN